MQNKREEKTTPRTKVLKKERGKSGLSRKEKAKVSARDIVATVQVQVAPKPGDYLFKATAATKVITNPKAGENLFREVKKRGRPCKALLRTAAAGSSVVESAFQAEQVYTHR